MNASTSTKTQTDQAALFDQAVETFESAVRAGVRLQEDTIKLYMDTLTEAGAPQDWQANTQKALKEVLPKLQKNAEEAVDALNRGTKESLELLQRAFEAAQITTPEEFQHKTRELWESSLGVLRSNAQTLVQANARALETWSSMFTKRPQSAAVK